ncbi:MAG: hypothetical protein H6R05_1462 [Burkholderiaceae bacterium]|nr:hypothetical protein [Burkholderiaceae bacterium]
MQALLSNSQVDKLGERLKNNAQITETDLRMLDAYRQTFSKAYEFVMKSISNVPHLKPSGRDAKSTMAIIDKLRRESIRLTQIQDIAGCRVVVKDIEAQEKLVQFLCYMFQLTSENIKDRRIYPSHGYRAVHLIVFVDGKSIEIQVRTELQHQWAVFSEKVSDDFGSNIKYGNGIPSLLNILNIYSSGINQVESIELEKFMFTNFRKVSADFIKTVLCTEQLTDEIRNAHIEFIKIIDEIKSHRSGVFQKIDEVKIKLSKIFEETSLKLKEVKKNDLFD